MKQKERKHLYKANHRHRLTMKMWLMLVKAWRYEYQFNFGIVKHHRRRSIAKRDLCRLMRGRIIDYYEHKNRKLHRVTMIPNPTWEWYLSARACISRRKYYGQ